MNPAEPHNLHELEAWLERVAQSSGFPSPPCPEGRRRHKTSQSIYLSLFQFDNQFSQAIDQSASKLWLHETEAFQDLPPEPGSILTLRIETAARLIGELSSTLESPFSYPDSSFQELIWWLLVDWWHRRGIHRAAEWYFLYSSDEEDS